MMKKLALACVIALLAFACKNETKQTETKETPITKVIESNPELTVTINFNTNKADAFKLLLNNIVVDEFQKKNIQVIEKVSASSKTDKLIAKFGENNISKNFLISLGNKEVKEVSIENIIISYGKETLNIKASDLNEHFIFNKFIDFDTNSNKIATKKINGKHNPVMILKAKTLNKLVADSKKKK